MATPPTPVGATVYAIGYPGLGVSCAAKQLTIEAPFTVQPLTVKKIHGVRRDLGMLNFPCFEVEPSLDHGFSGGGVLHEGRLCGIVTSGSSFDDRAYVASLWPITLMHFDNEFEARTSFADLIDRRVIRASDWAEAKPRISKRFDDFGSVYGHLGP